MSSERDPTPDPDSDTGKEDTPMTRQSDVPAVPGRQKYQSARPPGDYTEDFGGGTIEHPDKGADDDADDASGESRNG